jgi:hypothetical protein
MNKYYLCCNCGNEIEDEELPEICPLCTAGKEDIMLQEDTFFCGSFDDDDDVSEDEFWEEEING